MGYQMELSSHVEVGHTRHGNVLNAGSPVSWQPGSRMRQPPSHVASRSPADRRIRLVTDRPIADIPEAVLACLRLCSSFPLPHGNTRTATRIGTTKVPPLEKDRAMKKAEMAERVCFPLPFCLFVEVGY